MLRRYADRVETISQRELRNQSGEIMRRVRGGESFLVTSNGVVTALLTAPPADLDDDAVVAARVRSITARPARGRLDVDALPPRRRLRDDELPAEDLVRELRGNR